MAQKEIAIGISFTSQGEKKVVRNLQELEAELKVLNETIKGLNFGSLEYEQAAKNIQVLKTQVKEFEKSTEGLEASKRVSAVSDAISIAVGSFQTLSGVLTLAVGDSEEFAFVKDAEAFALGVLNTALGINAILTTQARLAEEGLTLATIKQTIATKAAAAATKVWNFVLLLNPVVAITAAVAALTAGIYLLIEAFGESNKEARIASKLNTELQKTTLEAGSALRDQLEILTDSVSTRELELKTIEDLKKAYPGFNAFLSSNNTLTEEGIEFLKTQIVLEEALARKKLLTQKILENDIESIEKYNEEVEFQNSLFGKSLTFLASLGNGYTQEFVKLTALSGAVEENIRKNRIYQAELDKVNQEIDDALAAGKPYQELLARRAKLEADAARESSKQSEALDLKLVSLQKLTKQYQLYTEALRQAQAADLEYAEQISQRQEEVLSEQETFLGEQADRFSTEGQRLLKELNDFLFKTIPTEEQLKGLEDGFFDLFNAIQLGISSGEFNLTKSTGFEDFVKFAEVKLPDLRDLLKNVNEESRASFVEYFKGLDNRVSSIKKALGDVPTLSVFFDEAELGDINKLFEAETKIAELRNNRVELGLSEQQLQQKSLNIIQESFGINDKIVGLLRERSEILFNQQFLDAEGQKIAQARIDEIDAAAKAATDLAKAILEGVINTNDFVSLLKQAEAQTQKNLIKIQEQKKAIEEAYSPENLFTYFSQLTGGFDVILNDVATNLEKYLERFGADGVVAILAGIEDGVIQQGVKTRQEAEKLITLLENVGDAISKAIGLGGNPFQKLIDDLKKSLGELPSEVPDFFDKLAAGAERVLQIYSDLSNRLAQVIASNNALLLEQLAYEEEVALQTIGDATEAQRLEQEKVRKEFAKTRFEVEKQARLQELQLTRAQVIAESSVAIARTFADLPFPAALPLSAVIAGLTAAQVQNVSNQITFVRSKQFVGRRGGLITGESHEGANGGVPTLLEGGEFVVNKEAVSRYGNIISDLNGSTGGRRLSTDDSRLIQSIASQNQTAPPLKAYVLFNDIQNTEKLNKKIVQLSRL